MRFNNFTALGAVGVLGMGLAGAPQANAAFVVTILQDGANVVVTGSGTVNLAGLTHYENGFGFPAAMNPSIGFLTIGIATGSNESGYFGLTGPSNFGTGGDTEGSSGSGNKISMLYEYGSYKLYLPSGYVSGAALSDTATYDNTTLAGLGVTNGSYTWTWGTGPSLDSYTIDVGPITNTPEPASSALVLAGLLSLGFVRSRTRPFRPHRMA